MQNVNIEPRETRSLLLKAVPLLCFTLIIVFCSARAFIGLTGTRLYSHDAFALLDPAWRMLNGQISHSDFSDNLGPIAHLPTVIGLTMVGGKAEGFGYGQAIAAFILGVWAYFASYDRLSSVRQSILCLAVVCLAVTPFALGYSPLSISPAMTYNRYGYAFTAIILTEALLELRSDNEYGSLLGGASTGFILVLLAFLKITFAVGAFVVVASLLTCRKQTRPRWIGLLSGSGLAVLLACLYFRLDFYPVLKDFTNLAAAKRLNFADYSLENILENAGTLFIFTVFGFMHLSGDWDSDAARVYLIAGTTICFVGLFLVFTCFEATGFPLQAVWPILGMELLAKDRRASLRSNRSFQVSMLAWTVLLVSSLFISSVISISYGVVHKFRLHDYYTGMNSSRLAGFTPFKEDAGYMIYVNDGLALVNKYRRPDDSVMSLDFTNPFSYGLNMKPARGGAVALQYQTTFDDSHRLSGDRLFGNAKIVMLPKIFSDGSLTESIPRLYGSYLNDNFEFVAESDYWKFYRHRASRLQ